MSKVLKTIDMELSTQSINRAIKEIESFRKQLVNCCDELVKTLVAEGIVVAQMNVMSMNAVYTGKLEDSIDGVFFPEDHLGVIFTKVPYAIFVEYGTGIVGAQNAHPGINDEDWKDPVAMKDGKLYLEYDSGNHGEDGWVYYCTTDNNKRFRWTKGMPSRPFMYNTYKWLHENAERLAGTAFR